MRVNYLALCAALTLTGVTSAGDTIRLSLPGGVEAPTFDLKARPADLDTKADPTHWGYRGWGGAWGGGFRGYHGGYWGGGFRTYHGGYWGGGFRSYYGGWYAPPVIYRAPVIGFGFYPSYSFAGSYYFPCSMDATVTVRSQPATAPSIMPRLAEPAAGPAQPAPSGTYEYNGGPSSPVPMPKATEEGASYPRKPTIVNEMFVSYPASKPAQAKPAKWVYPAYGEAPRRDR